MRILVSLLALGVAPAEGNISHLYDRIAADLRSGHPLVIHANVALCDNSIIRCGGHGLGDGDSLASNLYWQSHGGTYQWFTRRDSGWETVARFDRPEEDLLVRVVFRRRQAPLGALGERGVASPFWMYVIVDAWRGAAIDRAADRFVLQAHTDERPHSITLPDKTIIEGGSKAHVVAYIGHNRWMDYTRYAWPREKPTLPRGTIAVACYSLAYLRNLARDPFVPLLMTRDFLFAGGHSFEGAIRALGEGSALEPIRRRAAAAYAEGQRTSFTRVLTAFTNPGDKRWRD